jgi:lipopolysaccharide export system permease protein
MLPFFRLIDRYILGELFKPFLAGVVAFMIIMISNTLYIFMELIVKSNIDAGTVGRMLAFNLPAIVVVTLPVAYMFATLLALGRLGRDSEIIALRAAGVSLTRAIAPIILTAILISALGWFLQEKVVPWSNQQTVAILKDMMKKDTLQAVKEKNFIHADNRHFYVQAIDRKKNLLQGIYILDRSKGQPQIITAESGTRKETRWILYKGLLRKLDTAGFIDHEIRFERMEIEMDIKPEMVFNNSADVRTVASGEAAKLIAAKKKRGEDTRRDEMDYHTKFSLPLATFFTILLAAPIGIRFSKMGNYFGVAISIALVFIWYLAYSTFTNLGATGTVHPILAAWIQNIAFGTVGVLLLLQMQDIKVFSFLFRPVSLCLRPFHEALRGRPVSHDPDDKPLKLESLARERRTTVALHLLALPGFLIVPLIAWLHQRKRSYFNGRHAREVLNFHLSLLIYLGLEAGMVFALAWIFLLQTLFPPPPLPWIPSPDHFLLLGGGFAILTLLLALLAHLSAAVRSSRSEAYHYPLALPLIKAPGPSTAPPPPLTAEKIADSTDLPLTAETFEISPLTAIAEILKHPTDLDTHLISVEAEIPPPVDPPIPHEPLQIQKIAPGLKWRHITLQTSPTQLWFRQRGGPLAWLALLAVNLTLLAGVLLFYDQTQTLQLSFYCEKTPQQSTCFFEQRSLWRRQRNPVPVSAIIDIVVIPKEPPGTKGPKVFDIVMQLQKQQIWITTEPQEARAYALATNLRMFAQGMTSEAPRIEQAQPRHLLWLLTGVTASLMILLLLLWPLRWRKSFKLSPEHLSLRTRGQWCDYSRTTLQEPMLEPGWFQQQSLTLTHVEAGEEQILSLANGLDHAQAENLHHRLTDWLQSEPRHGNEPYAVQDLH